MASLHKIITFVIDRGHYWCGITALYILKGAFKTSDIADFLFGSRFRFVTQDTM